MEAYLLLLLNFSVTLFMTGLIWFVQLVHYPLFEKVQTDFVTYEQNHTRYTSWLTAPVMLTELAATLALWYFWPSYYVLNMAATVLIILIWISTFFIQIPLHHRLCDAFHPDNCRKLVKTNWLRTVAWTLKSLVMATYLVEIAFL